MKLKVQRLLKFRGHKMTWKSVHWKFWHFSWYSEWWKLTLLLLSNCLWPLMIWKQLQGEDQAVSMFLLKYAFWTYHEPGIPARDRIVRRPLKPDLERQYRWTFNVDKSIPLQGKFRKIFQPSLLLRTESKLEMRTFYASEKRMIF